MTDDGHMSLSQDLGFKLMLHASGAVAGAIAAPVPLSEALDATVKRLADGLIANGVEPSFIDGWQHACLETERVAACDMIVAQAITLARALGKAEALPDEDADDEGWQEPPNHSSHYSAISPISVTLPQSGKNRVTRYMANAYIEPFKGRWPVSPYIGAGLGAAQGHLTTFAAPARAPSAPPSQILDIKDTRFAWQAMADVSVPVTPHVALTAQYRWLDSGTFHGVDARGERATRTLHDSNADVGVRLTF